MTGLARWFDEVAQADIDAMLRDPLRSLMTELWVDGAVERDIANQWEGYASPDDILAIRGDDDVPWRDDAPPLDDEWWDSVGWW